MSFMLATYQTLHNPTEISELKDVWKIYYRKMALASFRAIDELHKAEFYYEKAIKEDDTKEISKWEKKVHEAKKKQVLAMRDMDVIDELNYKFCSNQYDVIKILVPNHAVKEGPDERVYENALEFKESDLVFSPEYVSNWEKGYKVMGKWWG